MEEPPRGICRGYVTEKEFVRTYDVGTETFHETYVKAIRGAHYAIVEIEFPLWRPSRFVVYDLWRAREAKGPALIEDYTPGVRTTIIPAEDKYNRTYDDLDVAIAATVLTYSTESRLLSQLERYTPIRILMWFLKKG